MEITINSQNIKVTGHVDTWYTIDTKTINGKDYFLMEHEVYGDEAACVIIDKQGSLVLSDVYNGFDDLIEFLEYTRAPEQLRHGKATTNDIDNFIVPELDSIDLALISAYESVNNTLVEDTLTSWFGDYAMDVAKHGVTAEQLYKQLQNALTTIGMSRVEYRSSSLPMSYSTNIRNFIQEKMRQLSVTSENSVRLFIDMDGTLAEFKQVDRLETLYEYGYFANLSPQQSVVDAVKEIISRHPEIEVYILSAHLSDSPYALVEKNQWLDQHLPEIDSAHRIFPPCGQDKKDFIPDGIRASDILLDDYTHNLTLWEPPARGIKLLNGINHTNGTWQGNRIRFDCSPVELAEKIVRTVNGDNVFDNSAKQDADIKQSKPNHLSKSSAQIMAAGYEPYHDKDGFHIFRNPKTKGLQFYKAGFEKVNGKYECRFQQLDELKDIIKYKALMPEEMRINLEKAVQARPDTPKQQQ